MRKIVSQLKEPFVAESQTWFNNCHASTIAKVSENELVAAFFGGETEGSKDMAIWICHKDEQGWHSPLRVFAQDGWAHWNPSLHYDGETLHIFYKVGKSVPTWKTYYASSKNKGKSWTEPRELVEGSTLPRGPVKNKIIVLNNGSWVSGSSIEDEYQWEAFVDISDDMGKTWTDYLIPFDYSGQGSRSKEIWNGLGNQQLWENDLNTVMKWDGVIQPTLWQSDSGSVHCLLRSTRGKIYRSDSSNGGKTWCTAYATSMPNNNSGIDVVRMDDGTLALVYNPVSGNWAPRSPISLSFSYDNGNNWTEPYHLETREGEYSYPAIIADKNTLHITYTANRKGMTYWKIETEKVV